MRLITKAHELKCICRRQACTWPSAPNKKGWEKTVLSADSALIEPFLFTPKTRVCLCRYAATTTKNNKSRYPQCPRLWNFGNIISNFQRFLLCAYCFGNGGARRLERPLVSIGWIRCSENLKKKCKL